MNNLSERLEALRLVESKTYRGTQVRGVNAREMREAYQVRAVLQEMAAKLAGDAFKGKAAPLRTEVTALRKAAKARNAEAYASHNLKLHRLIVEAFGNAVLLRLWESLDLETRARISLAQPSIDMPAAFGSHKTIVDGLDIPDALGKNDGKLAGHLLREHSKRCGRTCRHRFGIVWILQQIPSALTALTALTVPRLTKPVSAPKLKANWYRPCTWQ